VWFLTEPELELASSLFRVPHRHQVVGAGIAVPETYDSVGFRIEFGISDPFIYYAGRREWGKGWAELVAAFADYKKQASSDLKLVTSGVGELNLPPGLENEVVDVGFLTNQRRSDAMAAAAAYVQPSALESFSRTVMEAWLAGTMVIGNATSQVVKWHIERSDAGISYRGPAELVEALRFVNDAPAAATNLAAGGRGYVTANYLWEDVIADMESTLDTWLPMPAAAKAGV